MPEFVNPLLLWVLPAAAIPIIIYYLMRFRSLRVSWGANYVLVRALERLKKQLFLDQLLLIVFRTLACLALVIAFARPLFSSQSDRISGSGVHHVIVVDGSYSMLAADGARSRWDLGQDILNGLVGTWGRGERWSLVVLHDEPVWLVDGAVISDPTESAAALAKLRTAETRVSLDAALATVLAHTGTEKLEIYLLTDDQADAWQGVADRGLPAGVPLYWLAPTLESHTNQAVTAVTPAQETVLAGHPVRVTVTVRNFTRQPANDVAVELLLDGNFVGRETLSLLPDQAGSTHFYLTLDAVGSHAITARLADDALTYDNTLAAGIDVVDAISIAVLRDAARDQKFDSAYGFVDLATDVLGRNDEDDNRLFTRAPIRTEVLEGPVTLEQLRAHDVVLIDAGRTPDAELAAALRSYRDAGGGLLFAPDETIDVARWNQIYGGAGLLPADVGRLHTQALGSEQYETVAPTGFEHPAIASFEDVADRLANLRFFTWFDLDTPASDAYVLARFTGGSPVAVVERGNLGMSILFASGLNGRTNNLIVNELYFPLIFQVVSTLAAGDHYPLTVDRGEAIRARLASGQSIKAVTFNQQDQPAIPLAVPEGQDVVTVALPGGSDRSGPASLLVVRDAGSSRIWLGVQGERIDSDLTPLSAAERARLTDELSIVPVATWDELHTALRQSRRGAEWHPWVIAAMLLFLLGEMIIQRRFI